MNGRFGPSLLLQRIEKWQMLRRTRGQVEPKPSKMPHYSEGLLLQLAI
ncbi:hypothetical protein [Litoreibacter janthinus]|nr:hypothetical protein [Litoreibacter janthinus]